ncbi:MAG: S9 family peptidase [Bacteroidota bacterium]
MKRLLFASLFILGALFCLNAQEAITIEDIYTKGTFRTRSVAGFKFQNDGKHYTRLEKNVINKYDLTTGELVGPVLNGNQIIEGAGKDPRVREGRDAEKDRTSVSPLPTQLRINSYAFSSDEGKLLLKTQTERIYRRSSKANFHVWDFNRKTLTAVSEAGKQQYASFNAAADKVAYVRDNDLYYKDLISDEEVRITNDGQYNHIINGAADWVYEEEFSFAKAFAWSPDGSKIAFMRFDESAVKEFTMTNYRDGVYPEYVTFKYPKVGETNSTLSIHIYDLEKDKLVKADIGKETNIYIPRIKWTKDAGTLCIYRMNRHQNELELLLANAKNGKTSVLLKESNARYIAEAHFDNLTFLEDGKRFIWSSEKDGWSHIYLYDMKGKEIAQLTKGPFDVTRFYGVDEERGMVYYQAAGKSPLEREVYVVSMNYRKKRLLTPEAGTNRVQFSSTYDYFVNTHSTVNKAPTYTVYSSKGEKIRVIEDNANMVNVQQNYGAQPVEFFNFKTSEEVELNGWMIKPADFSETKQYPVLMYVYGGPGSQTVRNAFSGGNYWWFQMLAQKGYIVVSVDNRGTGARGEEFKKMTYLQLGKYETIDQIEAAKYLGSLDYIDAKRIGIFGWSYGGYMSSLCILKGNDVFKAAIAVAPVTNWKWYDTIYTERFMRDEQDNPDGYKDNSPVYFADRLEGAYLLVHGNGDDNVHFQNSAEMANALISANKHFDTYFYPNRNHGIYGDNARRHLYTKMTNFLLENL